MWWRVQSIKLLITQLSPAFYYFPPPWVQIFFSVSCSQTPSVYIPLLMWENTCHTHIQLQVKLCWSQVLQCVMCKSSFEALVIFCLEAYWTFWSGVKLPFQDEYVRNQMQAKIQFSKWGCEPWCCPVMTVQGMICMSCSTSKDGNLGMVLSVGQTHYVWGGRKPGAFPSEEKRYIQTLLGC